MILPESLHCYCLHLLRVSVSEVLQVYFTPDEFNPVAPAGAQNAPGEIGDCESPGRRFEPVTTHQVDSGQPMEMKPNTFSHNAALNERKRLTP